MRRGNKFDDDAAIFDALDRLIARVHAQLLADRLLDGDLAALSDLARQCIPPTVMRICKRQYAFSATI